MYALSNYKSFYCSLAYYNCRSYSKNSYHDNLGCDTCLFLFLCLYHDLFLYAIDVFLYLCCILFDPYTLSDLSFIFDLDITDAHDILSDLLDLFGLLDLFDLFDL